MVGHFTREASRFFNLLKRRSNGISGNEMKGVNMDPRFLTYMM